MTGAAPLPLASATRIRRGSVAGIRGIGKRDRAQGGGIVRLRVRTLDQAAGKVGAATLRP